MFDGLRPIPAGDVIPSSVHGVSVSIPDLASVVGFESGDPATLARISRGYPRFRTHPLVHEVAALLAAERGVGVDDLLLVRSERAARAAATYARLPPGAVFRARGIHGLVAPAGTDQAARARAIVQHTGGHLSSRQAEDVLYDAGRLGTRQAEEATGGDAAGVITAVLAGAYGAGDTSAVSLHNSGMNAVTATLAAVTEIQAERGRRTWIQFGGVFFDTVSVFEKAILDVERVLVPDPFDATALAAAVAGHAGDLAGILAEVPSNPLLQTPDLGALRAVADRAGVPVVLDATIATPYNLDLLAVADVVCESLTKYAAGSVDVLMGAAVVNPASPWASALHEAIPRHGDEPYQRDAARLAARITGYADRMARVNANAVTLAKFLERQPAVSRIHWAYEERSEYNYRAAERSSDSPGGLLLLDLRVPIETVYDRLAVAKGPSFGGEFTMASAQIFIAHYDLLATPEGREALRRRGLHRDMLRVSVGTEDPERIIATFEEAFADGA